jgi:hypothetical protein
MASCTSRGGVSSRISTGRDLHAPALGDLIELRAQDLVDLLALGEHVVEKDVADHGTERRGRDSCDGCPEVLDLEDGVGGLLLHHLLVDEEVDRDGCVVLVMHVCCGISTTNSRRSTLIPTWMGGGSKSTNPGRPSSDSARAPAQQGAGTAARCG